MSLNLEIKYFLFFLPVIQALDSKQEAIFKNILTTNYDLPTLQQFTLITS